MGRWVSLHAQLLSSPLESAYTKQASASRHAPTTLAAPDAVFPYHCTLYSILIGWINGIQARLSIHAGNKVARRLSEEGCQVAAWNRDASKAEALSAAGINVHHSAQDAAQDSDVLVLMLSDADAIKNVLLNADQPVNLQGKVVVQMGTIGQLPVL